MDSPEDRRRHLADWLVSRDNPYFTRAIVNRIWANFFGVGLVENVDDLRVTNPASNEKLLSAAANYLADQNFDLKALMRAILQSETYQRSSQPLAGKRGRHPFLFALLSAPDDGGGAAGRHFGSDRRSAPCEFQRHYPKGWRAMQLPDVST